MKIAAFLLFFFLLSAPSYGQSLPAWTALPQFSTDTVTALTVVGGKIWAGTKKAGLFRSLDGGENWDRIVFSSLPLEGFSTMTMAEDGRILASTSTHFIFSLNGGQGWSNSPLQGAYFFQSAATADGLIYVVYSGGVMRLGHSKTQPFDEVGQFGEVWDARSVGVSPGGRVFAGTWEGELLRMKSDRDSWEKLSLPPGFRRIMHVAANDAGMIAFADYSRSFFRSLDDGKSWKSIPLDDKIDSTRRLLALSDGTVLAATNQDVWVLRSGSENWTRLTDGLNAKDIYSMTIGSDGLLYAGTADGIFRANLNIASGVENIAAADNSLDLRLLNRNEGMQLHFFNPSAGTVSVGIYSLTGELISSFDEYKDAGIHVLRLENHLTAGIRLLRLESGKHTGLLLLQ